MANVKAIDLEDAISKSHHYLMLAASEESEIKARRYISIADSYVEIAAIRASAE